MKTIVNKVLNILSKREKYSLIALSCFSILISLIETIGVAAIMPFLSVISDFKEIHENEYYSFVYNTLNFKDDTGFVLFFGFALLFFYLFRGLINLTYFYSLNKFIFGRYFNITYGLFDKYMKLSYIDFSRKNSSALTKTIVNETMNLVGLISALMLMMSEVFVVIFIYCMMLYFSYEVTLTLTVILLIKFFFIINKMSVRMKKDGEQRAEVQEIFFEIINRSFGNYKFIKLEPKKDRILSDFIDCNQKFSLINIRARTMLQIPRLLLEFTAFSLIVGVILYFIWSNHDLLSVVPILTVFVISLYRLMPSINRIVMSYNQMMYAFKSLDIIYDDLNLVAESFGDADVNFKQKIQLENISFGFKKDEMLLDNINLMINRGDKIAFIGESGAGKSTLADLIMGLYQPSSGNIFIDGVKLDNQNLMAWRYKIGYIPQMVYLFDGTVAENVAFSKEYDKSRVEECLKRARISEFFMEKDGLESMVGEGGIMLSGGQKQRIAIARALYNDPSILVLDEATSALDDMTESEIMEEIYDLCSDKTLIIIAHRLSTIKKCNKVYKIQNRSLLGQTANASLV